MHLSELCLTGNRNWHLLHHNRILARLLRLDPWWLDRYHQVDKLPDASFLRRRAIGHDPGKHAARHSRWPSPCITMHISLSFSWSIGSTCRWRPPWERWKSIRASCCYQPCTCSRTVPALLCSQSGLDFAQRSFSCYYSIRWLWLVLILPFFSYCWFYISETISISCMFWRGKCRWLL